MIKYNLLLIAETMSKAFNQDWIINIRSQILKTCEEIIHLLENR